MINKKLITLFLTACMAMEIVLPAVAMENQNAFIQYKYEQDLQTETTEDEKTEDVGNYPFLERYEVLAGDAGSEQSYGASTYSGDIAGAGAEQFSNIDFFITIDVAGREVTNMSEEIHNYVTLYAGTTSIPPLVTIDTTYPVHITYHSTITDANYKTSQRILIKQDTAVTIDGIYFERASTSVYPSLEFETAGATLNFQGNNTFKVYSYGAVEETIKGSSNITSVTLDADDTDASYTIYVQEESRSIYSDTKFAKGTIRHLENSSDFGVTQTGINSNSGLMYVSGKTSTADGTHDGVLIDVEEDFFYDDMEYDPSTKILTLKSDKKYAIRYSTYINEIIVKADTTACPQMLFTTNTNSTFTRTSGSPFLTLYCDITIILGANPTFTFATTDLNPTIKGAVDGKDYTVYVRGYNKTGNAKDNYSNTSLNIYTSKAMDNIKFETERDGQVVVHPVSLPLSNSVFTVTDEYGVGVDVLNLTNKTPTTTQIASYDVIYNNISSNSQGTLYIATNKTLRITSSSGGAITTAASIHIYEGANVIFDNLQMKQVSGINTVLINGDNVTINLVGKNIISTTRNITKVRPLNIYKTTGFKLAGDGDLYVYSTNGTPNADQGITEGSDNDNVNDALLAKAKADGGATGDIYHYNLLNYPSALSVVVNSLAQQASVMTMSDGDDQTDDDKDVEDDTESEHDSLEQDDHYLITADKFSYDGYYLGVHTLDEITIGGASEFGVYVNVPDAKESDVAKIHFKEAEMYATPGTSKPYVVTNTKTEFIIDGWLALVDEDNAYLNVDSNIMHIYDDFHFSGSGIVYVISNAGVVPVKIENSAKITADTALNFIPYTYTGNEAVQASDFSITAVGEAVTAQNFLTLSTTPISEPFPYVETDSYTVRPITFFGEDFKESNGNIVNNMLLINTEEMVIIENKNQSKSTTHLIGVQEGLSSANIVFKGVNINVASDDPNLPLFYLLSDTNVTLFSGYDNNLTVKYDVGSPSSVPTVMVADGKNLNIVEYGGTLTMNSRYGASAVGGTMNNATPGSSSDSFSSVTLNDIVVTTKNASEYLVTGDVTFANGVLTINTNKEIIVSSVNSKISSNIRINIPAGIGGTANVTFKDLNIYYIPNSIIVSVSRDTNLFIEGNNSIVPYLASGAIYGAATIDVLGSSTLNIYGTDDDNLYLGQARYRGAGIQVGSSGELNIYGSVITGTPGNYQGSVIGKNYEATAHGTINIYDGIFYLGTGQNGRAIGNVNATGGEINILGGEIHLVGGSVIGSSKTTINIGNADGGSAIIYHYNSTYQAYVNVDNFSVFSYSTANIENWSGMIALVPTNYNKTSTSRYGHYKVYGDFTLVDEDFNIGINETLRFYTGNIALDFDGFENGVNPDDGVNYSMLSVDTISGLVNNGTIYRNAYFYQNPHLGNILPTGTGEVEISVTDYIVKLVPNTTGIYDCYRGNSLFDYYTIQENGKSVANIEELNLVLTDGNNKNLTDYIITDLGTYNVSITGNTASTQSLFSIATVSTKNTEKYNFDTLSSKNYEVSRVLAIGSTDISLAKEGSYSIDFGNIYYRGNKYPYTTEELLEKLVFTFDNREMVKGDGGEYIPKLLQSDKKTYYNNNDTFVDVQTINAIVSAVSTTGEADSIYNYGTTSQNYAGYLMSTVEILPRSVQDPNVTLDNFLDTKLYSDTNKDYQNEQDVELYYTYKDTKQLLVLGTDYTLTYYETGTDTVITNFVGIGVGEITLKVTGLGNFTGVIEKTYKLLGDLESTNDTINVVVNKTTGHGVSGYYDPALEIGLGGRPDPSDIVVKYNTTTLTYGVDYTLDYVLADAGYKVGTDTYPAISIDVIGINDYTGVKKEENVPYYVNSKIEPLDTSAIYFRPDNTVDVSLIKIYAVGSDTAVSTTAYEIISTKGSSSDTTIIEITIKTNGLLDGNSYYYNFEIQPQPAGSGDADDFSKGEIHLVETVYQRLDGTYHLEDDLVLWVTDGSDTLVMLEKDKDYTIDIDDKTAIVTAIAGSGYTGTVTFDFETDIAGSGTGLDVFKGIIDLVEPIQIPGNADSQSTETDKQDTLLEEIQANIQLVLDGYTLIPDEHFVIEITDWSTIIDNNKIISNTVQVNVIGQGELTGETREFYVNLVSSTTFVNIDNLYIKPDYTVDIDDLTLIHPVYKTTLTIHDYESITPIWSDLNGDGIKEFIAVTVKYSTTFIDAMKLLNDANNQSAINFMARVSNNSVSYFVSPKTAGTGTNINYGLINIADSFYYRPDGELYLEDIVLTAGDGNDFFQGTEYKIDSHVLDSKWSYANAGLDGSPTTMTHLITVQGLDNDDRLGGSETFYINVQQAGSGTSKDFSQGIIEQVPTVYYRPDNLLYLAEDLKIVVEGTRLVLGTDYTITNTDLTNRTVTIQGIGSYTGETTFKYTVSSAGANATGTKDISDGIIYAVYQVTEREGVLGGVFDIEDLTIQVNGGVGVADPITLVYGVDYDVKNLVLNYENSKVTLVGKGDYAGSEITFNIIIIPYNSSAVHVETIVDIFQSETIYQRPDGKYYFTEDLVLHYYNSYPDTTTIVLGYGSDYYISTSSDGEYIIHGLGDYRGTTEVTSKIDTQEAGTGIGNNVREGIIYKADPVVKTTATLDINQLELYVNDKAYNADPDTQVMFYDYNIEVMSVVSPSEVIVKLTGINDYTNTTTFSVMIDDQYVPPTSSGSGDGSSGSSSNTTTPLENPFDDVFETDWFYDDVLGAFYSGLMIGTADRIFSPYTDTTRAMIVEVLYRLEGEPEVELTNMFDDVSSSVWYAKSVTWASQNGIVYGVGENLYKPEDELTREQIVTILARYTAYKENDDGNRADLSKYTDIDEISEYAVDSMQWAVENEIIKGKTDTTIDPSTNASRAEIATIINRYNNLFLQD